MAVNASDAAADAVADNTSAGTVAPAGEEAHADPSALGLNATAWTSLAMIVVIVLLLWKKVPGTIGASLDKQIAAIRANLEEAASLRADAEKIKAEYEARAKAAAGEAEQLLAHAREEAEAIVTQARTNAAALIERRGKMAEDKIAAAERAAVAEVRARAANAATAAATKLIAEKHDAKSDKPLVDEAIGELGSARLN